MSCLKYINVDDELEPASWASAPDTVNAQEIGDPSAHTQVVAALLFYSTLDKCLAR
jgi:hypothetical protein